MKQRGVCGLACFLAIYFVGYKNGRDWIIKKFRNYNTFFYISNMCSLNRQFNINHFLNIFRYPIYIFFIFL